MISKLDAAIRAIRGRMRSTTDNTDNTDEDSGSSSFPIATSRCPTPRGVATRLNGSGDGSGTPFGCLLGARGFPGGGASPIAADVPLTSRDSCPLSVLWLRACYVPKLPVRTVARRVIASSDRPSSVLPLFPARFARFRRSWRETDTRNAVDQRLQRSARRRTRAASAGTEQT